MTIRFVYPLELLFTATLLALVPYALLRGPFNRLARLFLPPARPPPVEPAPNDKFIAEETHQGRADAILSESKAQSWSKPAAMAIPKGGYFQDKVEQGRYGPILQDPGLLRLLHCRENHSRPRRAVLRTC